jgi:hypothetical protein
MNAKSQELTAHESLELIKDMIKRAKQSFFKVSFFYLIWGWLMFAASLGEFVLRELIHYPNPWVTWPILSVIGGALSGWYGSKQDKTALPSFMDRVHSYVWGGYGILLFLTIGLCVTQGLNPSPFVLILTGLPTFISGGLTKFKPLLFGAVAFWILGAISFFVGIYWVPLIYCLAMLVGYLIPGYLLRKEEANG